MGENEKTRGWGLKCLKEIPKGSPVIEYVGELIDMNEFHRREKEQEEMGTMYCLEVTPEDSRTETYCIDSGFKGNHARFINHSVNCSTTKAVM